jgi:hypothetical protein
MASTNSSTFSAINTATPDKINIMFRAPYASSYLTWLKCVMCPFSCCCFENVKERLYFYVMENRIELNQPGICTINNCANLLKCNFKPDDNVTVVYYDKNFLQNAAKAECCKPVRPKAIFFFSFSQPSCVVFSLSRTAHVSQTCAIFVERPLCCTATASAAAAVAAAGS